MSKSTKKEITFRQAFNEYFKLLGDYEKNKKKIALKLSKEQLSNTEKSELFKKDLKCVRCKKNGGTLFQITNNKLIAKCGNLDSPCKLNIELERAFYNSLISELPKILNNINELKNNIIKIKLNFMYGFETEEVTLNKFQTLKKELINLVSEYKILSSQFSNFFENESNKDEILVKQELLFNEIDKFNILIDEYLTTNDNQFIKDAVNLNSDRIFVIAKEIQNLKYKAQYISQDGDDVKLIQQPYDNSIFDVKEKETENKIIAFIL